jgi:hypothetical protein
METFDTYWYRSLQLVYSKIQRNDKCFCNSGKKFKRCCMLKNKMLLLTKLATGINEEL